MRRALMLSGALIGVAMFAAGAMANPPPWSNGHHNSAPAPLVAAGIPAFFALGGAAAVHRFMRRYRGTAQGADTGSEPAGSDVS
jgi:hypothetical protein